jgi:cobaltochelatase CobN
MVRELEKEFDVFPAFCYGMGDAELGAKPSGEVIEQFFLDRLKLDALINLQSVFNAGTEEGSTNALKELDVLVFHPLMAYYKTEEEWRENSQGLSNLEVGWSVAMPEFEGVIEPIIIGAPRADEEYGAEFERHVPINERVAKIVGRMKRWIALKDTPKSERKVAFILHNNPCASVEATVGSAAHLDALESVARILKRMKAEGYSIDPPKDGKALSENIMNRKAISEFRWTTVDEIVSKGGALAMITKADYENWFDTLTREVKEKTCAVWGNPPGAAMVYDGKIVVTGIEYGADVIVHVGTHGNLEFLPGKSVALSESCYPDIAIGNLPHIYIYNSDNPSEGTIAKRRSYATLIDHMQTVMTESGLYGDLKDLEDHIAEYNKVKSSNKARTQALEHIIIDLLRKTKLAEEIRLDKRLQEGYSCDTT